MVIYLVSCQDKTKVKIESNSNVSLNSENIDKADIDFKSNPMVDLYRDVITDIYNELEVNFASYYVITTWGCGSGCVTGVMVDVRDGYIYSMPEDKEWGGNGTYIESSKDSQILLAVATAQSPIGEIEERRKYWKWDEELKEFKFINEDTVLLERDE